MSCQSDKRVPELDGRCVGFALAKRRLIRRFTALVVVSNLVRAIRPIPAQLHRRIVAAVVEPCRLRCSMPVGALPHLADPAAIDAPLPADASGCSQPVHRPGAGFCRVFQHAAKSAHRVQRSRKTAAVVTRPVVFTAPSLVVDRRKRTPQLAGRVRHHRPRPTVFAGVSLFRPRINFWQSCIASIRLYKYRGNVSHNYSLKADANKLARLSSGVIRLPLVHIARPFECPVWKQQATPATRWVPVAFQPERGSPSDAQNHLSVMVSQPHQLSPEQKRNDLLQCVHRFPKQAV